MPLAEGARLGSCRLVRKIGEGGMAEVWEAVDVGLERRVAIKVVKETISSLPEFDARFRREARTAAQLEHPHILPIYGFGVEEGVAYIEMPFLSGGTLGSRLEGPEPPSPETACGWVADLASALDAAHARGIIHRDLKAVNVLFDQSGRIVLADFGLAKSMTDRSGLTAAGTLMGTPMYLSPEQSRGEELTPASDQFSLGVLAYRMLTGQLPWGPNAAPAVVMIRIVSHAAPPPSSLRPSLPKAVDAVFERVLAKGPAGRYASCGEFAEALSAALLPPRAEPSRDAETVVEASPLPATPQAPVAAIPAPRPPRPHARAAAPAAGSRRPVLVALLLVFLGVNSVVLGLVVWDKFADRLPWSARPAGSAPAPQPTPAPAPAPSPTAEAPAAAPTEAPAATAAEAPAEQTPTPTPKPEPSPTPTAVPTPTPAPSLPEGAIPPMRTSDVRPVFSDDLVRRHAGLDGQVALRVFVNADGSVGEIAVEKGLEPEVDAAVVEAARRQLAYTPASLRGKPIAAPARVVVGVRFRVVAPSR